jgi:FlaA1/EpsC-like NDP-sugar epimerase
MKAIIGNCRLAKVPYRTLPGIAEVIDGRVELSQVREVQIEDLLRRPPVETNRKGIGRFLSGKRVMVTGAGGSIGSELCRQILPFKPMSLILVERGEWNLFQIEGELRKDSRGVPFRAVLGDVADRDQMEALLEETHPQAIFHAAAYKHVPLCEANIRAAFENNVLGTKNMSDLAASYGVEVFVLVSTDKAVHPANVMGATKRACELYLRKLATGAEGRITRYLTVRFGNVLDSSGSVIPTFRKQIENGGPVTVTHPEMTRFFMTIPESCQLILQAACLGRGGEVFVLDMGEPVRILDLARDLIALLRPEGEVHIPIAFTGLRPGEKLAEELWNADEAPLPTEHPKILKARISSPAEMNGQLDWFGGKIPFMTEAAAHRLLSELVPEYMAEFPVVAFSGGG